MRVLITRLSGFVLLLSPAPVVAQQDCRITGTCPQPNPSPPAPRAPVDPCEDRWRRASASGTFVAYDRFARSCSSHRNASKARDLTAKLRAPVVGASPTPTAVARLDASQQAIDDAKLKVNEAYKASLEPLGNGAEQASIAARSADATGGEFLNSPARCCQSFANPSLDDAVGALSTTLSWRAIATRPVRLTGVL